MCAFYSMQVYSSILYFYQWILLMEQPRSTESDGIVQRIEKKVEMKWNEKYIIYRIFLLSFGRFCMYFILLISDRFLSADDRTNKPIQCNCKILSGSFSLDEQNSDKSIFVLHSSYFVSERIDYKLKEMKWNQMKYNSCIDIYINECD